MTLFWLAAAWLAGIGLDAAAPLTSTAWLILAGIAFLFWLRLRDQRVPRWCFGLLLALCLGAARSAATAELSPDDISQYNDLGAVIQLRGTVVDYPETADQVTRLLVEVESISSGTESSAPVGGKLLAWVDPWPDWRYGDRVELVGEPETPPEFETFSYRTYLAQRGIYSVMLAEGAEQLGRGSSNLMLSTLFALRRRAHKTVLRLFPEPEASLLSGILLGIESGIPERVQRAFDTTGTTHIIAISGFNISIIAGLFMKWLGRWLGARRGALAAAGAIAGYTLLVGADAAVVRAAIMAGLALAARRLGRQQDGLAALGASAVLMTLHRPAILWDVGFQLSFAATLGLLRFSEPMQFAFERFMQRRLNTGVEATTKVSSALQDVLFVTLAAQLTTLPLSLLHFERLSLAAPLANLIILPLQPATMILGGIATVAGTIWLPLGIALGWLAWPFPALTIRVVEAFASQGWSSLALPPVPWPLIALLYAVIFGLPLLSVRREQPWLAEVSLRLPATLALAALAVATTLAWEAASTIPDGRMHVTLLDVGSGQAVLVQTESGRNLLINGGASSLRLGEGLDRRLSPLQRDLDWIVLLGGSDAEIGGLAGVIERYPLGAALTATAPGSAAYAELIEQVQNAGRPVVAAEPELTLKLGTQARAEILAASSEGSILMIQHGNFRALLAANTHAGWTKPLRQRGARGGYSAVLLPASGSSQATSAADLAWLNPQLVLLAVEAGNRQGLPSPRLLQQLNGRTVLRTDLHGWIQMESDGNTMSVETERRPAAP